MQSADGDVPWATLIAKAEGYVFGTNFKDIWMIHNKVDKNLLGIILTFTPENFGQSLSTKFSSLEKGKY